MVKPLAAIALELSQLQAFTGRTILSLSFKGLQGLGFRGLGFRVFGAYTRICEGCMGIFRVSVKRVLGYCNDIQGYIGRRMHIRVHMYMVYICKYSFGVWVLGL